MLLALGFLSLEMKLLAWLFPQGPDRGRGRRGVFVAFPGTSAPGMGVVR